MSEASADDKQFRRGVILGLTLAEIMLLLIFLLMLLLAPKLLAMKKELSSYQVRAEQAEHQLVELRRLIKGVGSDTFDITKEWVRAQDELKRLRAEMDRNRSLIELAKQRATETPTIDPQSVANQIKREADVGRRFRTNAKAMFRKRPASYAALVS